MRKGGNLKQNTKGLEPSRMKGCEKLISTMDGGGGEILSPGNLGFS